MIDRILITGGIGTGKSTVMQMFKDRLPNFHFDDMDKFIDNLYLVPTLEFKEFLLREFDSTDKKDVGIKAFMDPSKRAELDNFLYKYVDVHLTSWMRKPYNVAMEFPLFFEMLEKAQKLSYNENVCYNIKKEVPIIVIRADEPVRIKRILERSKTLHPHWNEEIVSNILNSQMKSSIKEKKATYVIDNSGSLENTKHQVLMICELLGI